MHDEKKTNKVASAGVAGAIVGAGLTAAAIALTDKKNREKVVHSVRNFRKQAADALSKADKEIKKTTNEVKEQKEKLVEDIKEPSIKTDEKILKSI